MRDQVIVYQVQSPSETKEFQESIGDFDRISIGQELKVWVAGDKARIVRGNRPLVTKRLWFLACPVISIALLVVIGLKVSRDKAALDHR
jgi:hypothetical protein